MTNGPEISGTKETDADTEGGAEVKPDEAAAYAEFVGRSGKA